MTSVLPLEEISTSAPATTTTARVVARRHVANRMTRSTDCSPRPVVEPTRPGRLLESAFEVQLRCRFVSPAYVRTAATLLAFRARRCRKRETDCRAAAREAAFR